MPTISVIIPAYNCQKTIRETIESVLNQSFTDFELIVIDDGSTDLTVELVRTIKDNRLRLYSYANCGVAESRNRGIDKSAGKFVSFLDADDLWTIDKLESQLQALSCNKAAVAYSWTDSIDSQGMFLRSGSYINVVGDIYHELLLRDFIESGSNPLIRSDALKTVGKFDCSLSNAHDWDMWLRLAHCFNFVVVPKVQVLYRVSSNSMSNNILGMESSSIKVIHKQYHCPSDRQPPIENVLAHRYRYLTFKAIERQCPKARVLTSMRFFGLALKNDPSWLLHKKVMVIFLLKIMAIIFFPTKQLKKMLKLIKNLKYKINSLDSVCSRPPR